MGPCGARPPDVFWCILGINVHPFDCLMTRIISCVYCPLKESFREVFVIHCPGREKRFRAHNLAAVWGGVVRFLGEGIPPPKDVWSKRSHVVHKYFHP